MELKPCTRCGEPAFYRVAGLPSCTRHIVDIAEEIRHAFAVIKEVFETYA